MFTISCNNLSNIDWKNAKECLFDLAAGVSVWKMQVSDFIPSIPSFYSLLSPYEIEKANRLNFEKDRNAYIIRWGMLRFLLSKYLMQDPKTIAFVQGQNNKPFVLQNENSTSVFFSISHAHDLVVMAFANKEIGIDVEKVNSDFNYTGMLSTVFSEEEQLAINGSENKLNRFYTFFTRKESLLKATGKGIINNLNKLSVLDENQLIPIKNEFGITNHWKINSFHLDGDYEGSITYPCEIEKIDFYEVKEVSNIKL